MIVAGVVAPVTDAAALWDRRLELFVSEAVTHEDNVFRLAGARDPTPILGSSSKGDTYRVTSFGFNLDVPVSRQRLLASLTWNDTRYHRFTVLNLNGHEGRAAWQWQVGDDLGGQLGYTESLTLASLANIQSGVQSSTPNTLKITNAYVNAAYKLTPRWQLRGELGRLQQSNSVPERKVNDISVESSDLTFSYVTPADNQIGLNMRVADASFPNPLFIAGIPLDNAYRQKNVAVVADWTLTGRSHVSARAGRVSRSYAQLPQRDFDGETYHAAYDWKPTGKLTLTAMAQKDISATEQVNVGFVLVKRVGLYPALRLTEKTSLSGFLENSDREYAGDPGLVLGTVPPRSERVRSAGMTVSYRPTASVTLFVALRRETRTATVDFGDYVVNALSVSGRLAF
jgi:exopolysaccharide biosynthesis operon protein EpsL